MLQNIAAIETKGLDLNLAYRDLDTGFGKFGLTWNNTLLTNYDVIVPITGGTQVISREGTEQGQPSQASRSGSRSASSIGTEPISARP